MPLSRDQTLKLSIVEGGLYAVMLGASESYLGAFAVELGHGPHSLAVLSTLPLLFGAVSQLCSVALIRVLGSRKRLVVCGAAFQALSMIGLVLIALTAEQRMWPLLLTKTVFGVSGSVMAPAWGDWIGVLTQGISRPRYFGIRSGVVNAAMLAAFLSAGFSLHQAQAHPLTAYAWMFAAGMTARGLSSVVTPSWTHPRRWAKAIYTRLFSVRPTAGASLRPIPVEDEEQD